MSGKMPLNFRKGRTGLVPLQGMVEGDPDPDGACFICLGFSKFPGWCKVQPGEDDAQPLTEDAMTNGYDLKAMAMELIASQSTMALATGQNSEAWAAPVYYVFYRGVFYFFSAPDSRHIRDAMASGQAGAAIYPFVCSWKDIRGIQMSGRIQKVGPGLKAVQAVRAYIERYPFVKEFFDPGQEMDLESFGSRFRVRFYSLTPTLIYYLDNSIRFGFRQAITL